MGGDDWTDYLDPPLYELPEQHAEVRPGPTAPHPPATGEDWGDRYARLTEVDGVIAAARDLWARVRYPRRDPAYRHILPGLRLDEAILLQVPPGPARDLKLKAVRSYLPQKRKSP
jgi:hypothetical protein